jgi:hypothetical protein
MTRQRNPLIGALIALAVLGVGFPATGCSTPVHAGAHEVSVVKATIVIDPQPPIMFGPAPAGAKPALSPQQAWARYMRLNPRVHRLAIPAYVAVHLGFINGELAYGYSWHSCPISTNPRVKKLPPNPCREWNFIDATTGRQILDTWQL